MPIKLLIWDLGDTLITPPPGGQDTRPLDTYSEIRLRPGALGTLQALQDKGYRHAVLSNTAVSDSEHARRMLKNLCVESLFDYAYATASELDPTKPGKPDSIVFHNVLDALQTNPTEAVMVGNTWDTDILGANRSGIHALWLQNPEVSIRHDFSSPISTPPWIIPIWDVQNVPEALTLMCG